MTEYWLWGFALSFSWSLKPDDIVTRGSQLVVMCMTVSWMWHVLLDPDSEEDTVPLSKATWQKSLKKSSMEHTVSSEVWGYSWRTDRLMLDGDAKCGLCVPVDKYPTVARSSLTPDKMRGHVSEPTHSIFERYLAQQHRMWHKQRWLFPLGLVG